jgi:hypothetical protein
VHWPINLDEEGVLVVVADAEAVVVEEVHQTDPHVVAQVGEVVVAVLVEDVIRKRKNGSLSPS